MSRHTDSTLITTALRDLDPAPAALTAEELTRADAAFARIVATPVEEVVVPESVASPGRRRRLLAGVGVVGAAAIAVPALLLAGGNAAYASWSPEPEPLTGAAAAAAAGTCRAALGVPDGGERIEVAESRGAWTYVVLAGTGVQAVCLMPDDLVGRTGRAGGDFFGSYDPDAAALPTPAPDGIEETSSVQGSTDEGWFVSTEGVVGNEVTGITVHTSSGLDLEASVAGTRFAAWWPAEAQSSKRAAETWSYTLHLVDGSTRDVG